MDKIDQRAIDFFTTPCKLANPESKDPLAEKIGFTALAILAIIALGIIIPLITCWAIKHHMQKNESASVDEETGPAHSTHTSPAVSATAEQISAPPSPGIAQTTIDKIGDYAAIVNHADPKMQQLFDLFLRMEASGTDIPTGTIILDIQTGCFEKYIASGGDPAEDDMAEYMALIRDLSPSIVAYFGEVITKHEGHDKMILSTGFIQPRGTSYQFHQDHLGATYKVKKQGLFHPFHKHNKSQWSHGTQVQEGLMLIYKQSPNGHILPTTVAEAPNRFTDLDQAKFTKAELEDQRDRGLMHCRPMAEHQAVVLNNRTGIHATTNYDGAEVFLGEGEGDKYFDPADRTRFTEDIYRTPICRFTASTYCSKPYEE